MILMLRLAQAHAESCSDHRSSSPGPLRARRKELWTRLAWSKWNWFKHTAHLWTQSTLARLSDRWPPQTSLGLKLLHRLVERYVNASWPGSWLCSGSLWEEPTRGACFIVQSTCIIMHIKFNILRSGACILLFLNCRGEYPKLTHNRDLILVMLELHNRYIIQISKLPV